MRASPQRSVMFTFSRRLSNWPLPKGTKNQPIVQQSPQNSPQSILFQNERLYIIENNDAKVAELADAPDLGSGG